MCGYPFSRAAAAAAHPCGARAGARALRRRARLLDRYRRSRRFCRSAGSTTPSAGASRITTHDSQSGYQAPRALARAATRRHARRRAVRRDGGPLVTPRRVVEAIVRGRSGRRSARQLFATTSCAVTSPTLAARAARSRDVDCRTPIPPLVAAPATCPRPMSHSLRDALLATVPRDELAAVACGAAAARIRFASPPRPTTTLRDDARATDAAGYPRIA